MRPWRAWTRSGCDYVIVPYLSYGTADLLFLKGRVLRERQASQGPGFWANAVASYRRITSLEVPHATVRAKCGDAQVETRSDEEGFFSCELKNPTASGFWQTVEFELLEPKSAQAVRTSGRTVVPQSNCGFGVISDIDDTIVMSHATNPLRVAKTVLLQGACQRIAFPGVAAFYRTLSFHSNAERNPIFYVSSAPWNIYDLTLDILELNKIPLGPILLQDYGWDRRKFFCASHAEHKTLQIQRIMATYPELSFVLIGDSGQQDAEIYSAVLEQTPNRVRAVYIRDVSQNARDEEVRTLASRAAAHGGQLLLVRDSLEAATHAAGLGLITQEDLATVDAEFRTGGAAV